MFSRLGDRILWGDEVEVAFLAKNVLKYGYPNGYDGRYLVCDECGEEKDTILYKDNFVWRYHPWMMHYLTATSFILFGISDFTARLPFAIFGLLSLVMIYFFTIKLTNDRKLAILSTILLAFFIPFYLYSRQCRYYPIVIFFSLAVLYSYIKLIKNEKNGFLLLFFSSVFLFYTNYIPFFSVYSAVILHLFIFHLNKNTIKKILICSFLVAVVTLPWFLYADIGKKSHELSISYLSFGFVYISSYMIFYIFPLLFVLFLPYILFYKDKQNRLRANGEFWLIALTVLSSLFFISFSPYDLPSLRHITFIFPIFAILSAKVILNINKFNRYAAIFVLLLIIFTNYLLVVPFKAFEGPLLNNFEKDSEEYLFIKDNLRVRYFLFDYVYEIMHDYDTPNEKITNYLVKNSKEYEKFVTNYDEMTLVFYTKMLPADANESADWIIPRSAAALWGGQDKYLKILEKVDDRYERIVINSTDYIYPLDSPEPRVHRFKENKEMKTSDIYPYETYPIDIYHLKK